MNIYLHHYPASLFSEKVRLLLGYLGLPWHSVEIPSIMPRPHLMPLTGGYRKTPCLQIGANVFCDTAVIARGLARHADNDELFGQGFNAARVAEWADSQLFRVTVALNFRPEALGSMMTQLSTADLEAFQKDRAELTGGAPIATISATAALAFVQAYLADLDASVGDPQQPFLFGKRPCIADFSVYHCLWFLRNNAVNAPLLSPFANLMSWYERMQAFGHGQVTQADGPAALGNAKENEPLVPNLVGPNAPEIALGSAVTVTPVDYGCIPVSGRLLAWDAQEVVIERETEQTGIVATHFPSPGFEVALAG